MNSDNIKNIIYSVNLICTYMCNEDIIFWINNYFDNPNVIKLLMNDRSVKFIISG